jgi:hypothetical protein
MALVPRHDPNLRARAVRSDRWGVGRLTRHMRIASTASTFAPTAMSRRVVGRIIPQIEAEIAAWYKPNNWTRRRRSYQQTGLRSCPPRPAVVSLYILLSARLSAALCKRRHLSSGASARRRSLRWSCTSNRPRRLCSSSDGFSDPPCTPDARLGTEGSASMIAGLLSIGDEPVAMGTRISPTIGCPNVTPAHVDLVLGGTRTCLTDLNGDCPAHNRSQS